MLTLLFAAALAATPSPKPTAPLKVIVNVKSSSLCTLVQKTASPIAYVTQRNEQAFAAIDHSMLKFMENTRGVTSVSAAEMQTMDNELDDAQIYGPSSEMNVVQMDKVAYEIAQNIALEDKVMDASWKEYPKGQFPNVDAMRQRLQNLLDLQRALNNQYLEFTGVYLDNRGQAKFNSGYAAAFKSLLRDTILGLGSALADVHADGDPEIAAKASAHDTARYGNVGEVVKELRLQEYAFAQEMSTAVKTCGF